MSITSSRASLLLPVVALVAASTIVACGDDSGSGGLGGESGTTSPASSSVGGSKTTTTTSGTSGSTTGTATSGTTSSATATTAASTTATTASSSDAASSSATGIMACMGVQLVSVVDDTCDAVGNLAFFLEDNVDCSDLDGGSAFPVKVYALTVAANDCIHVRVTNVIGATDVSDTFVTVIDPDGGNHVFDDDIDCIPGNGDGLCADGGLTMATAGTAYLAVGAYAYVASPGCPAMGNTDYQISVSVNGTDIDIGTAPVCTADLTAL